MNKKFVFRSEAVILTSCEWFEPYWDSQEFLAREFLVKSTTFDAALSPVGQTLWWLHPASRVECVATASCDWQDVEANWEARYRLANQICYGNSYAL